MPHSLRQRPSGDDLRWESVRCPPLVRISCDDVWRPTLVTVIRPLGSGAAPTLAHVVEAFLSAHTRAGAWSAGTSVKYRQTLTLLTARLAGSPVARSVAALDTAAGAAALDTAFTDAFGVLAPATRARHLAALRSALRWWRTVGWLVGDPTTGWARPKIGLDHSRALTVAQIDALWHLPVGVRDKTLWRLLFESAARANEILTLNVADLDLVNTRARVVSKGGDIDWVCYQTGTALLLPRLLSGRTRGPVFLADRRPTRTVAGPDLCPVTGRARLRIGARPKCSNRQAGRSRPPGSSTAGRCPS